MSLHDVIGVLAYAVVLTLFGLMLAYPFLRAAQKADDRAERIYDAMTQKDTTDE